MASDRAAARCGRSVRQAGQVVACTECGLVEWYVKDPAALVEHQPHLEIVDGGSKDEGPYR